MGNAKKKTLGRAAGGINRRRRPTSPKGVGKPASAGCPTLTSIGDAKSSN
nr:hypothetical protein PFCWREHM_PFCWREHM_CDS_0010 [Microvirus sp.]